MYFEKQKNALCLIHALNNLLGGKIYTKRTLDILAKKHAEHTQQHISNYCDSRGNYSMELGTQALEQKHYHIRHEGKSLANIKYYKNHTDFLGFLIHIPGHYTSISHDINNNIWYCDSQLKPVLIQNVHNIFHLLPSSITAVISVWKNTSDTNQTPWISCLDTHLIKEIKNYRTRQECIYTIFNFYAYDLKNKAQPTVRGLIFDKYTDLLKDICISKENLECLFNMWKNN